MAIAIDQASLGTNTGAAGSTTIAFTTTAAVASGGFIVVSVGWFNAGVTVSSVADGTLSWTVDNQQAGAAGANNRHVALASAQAPSGLASGATITATFSGSAIVRQIGGTSFTGVTTTSPVEATDGPVDQNTSTTAWTTNSVAISAGSVLIGSCWNEALPATSTPTSPSLEALDWAEGADTSQTTCYRIEASGGSYTVAGTWSSAVKSTTIAVAYLASTAVPQTLRPDADIVTTGWATAPLFSKINESSADGTVITATAS